MTHRIRRYSILIFLLLSPFEGITNPVAQPSGTDRAFSDSLYQELKQEKAYQSYLDLEKQQKPFVLKALFLRMIGFIMQSRVLRFIFSMLPYIFIVLALLLIFLKITNLKVSKLIKPRAKDFSDKVYVEDEYIQEMDLDQLQEKALNNGKDREALRYAYLKLLKVLNQRGLIYWQPHKSNYDYQQELSGKSVYPYFCQISRDFDYVWYGEFQPGKSYFKNTLKRTHALIHDLETKR